jgi:hypothetical protein
MPEREKKDPTGGRDHTASYREGVLIARREGSSIAANSIGPLWVLEVNEPGSEDHGKIVRCFEPLDESIMPGNVADNVPPVWFRMSRMLRPDGVRIEVAVDVRTTPPEHAPQPGPA